MEKTGANSKAGKDPTPSRKRIRKEPQGTKKKESKKIALRKKITSFIKKYHSWPAALNIRQYHKGNILLLLHFYECVFFNIIHL